MERVRVPAPLDLPRGSSNGNKQPRLLVPPHPSLPAPISTALPSPTTSAYDRTSYYSISSSVASPTNSEFRVKMHPPSGDAARRPRQSSRNISGRNRVSTFGNGNVQPGGATNGNYYGTISNGDWSVGGSTSPSPAPAQSQPRSTSNGSGMAVRMEEKVVSAGDLNPHLREHAHSTDKYNRQQPSLLTHSNINNHSANSQPFVPLRGSHFLVPTNSPSSALNLPPIRRASSTSPARVQQQSHSNLPPAPAYHHVEPTDGLNSPASVASGASHTASSAARKGPSHGTMSSHSSRASFASSGGSSTPTKRTVFSPVKNAAGKLMSPPPPPPSMDLPLPPLPPLPRDASSSSSIGNRTKELGSSSAGDHQSEALKKIKQYTRPDPSRTHNNLPYRAPTNAPQWEPLKREPRQSSTSLRVEDEDRTEKSLLAAQRTSETDVTVVGLGLGTVQSEQTRTQSTQQTQQSHPAQPPPPLPPHVQRPLVQESGARSVSEPLGPSRISSSSSATTSKSPFNPFRRKDSTMTLNSVQSEDLSSDPGIIKLNRQPSPVPIHRRSSDNGLSRPVSILNVQSATSRRSEDSSQRPTFVSLGKVSSNLGLPLLDEKRPVDKKKSSNMLGKLFGRSKGKDKDKAEEITRQPSPVSQNVKPRKSFDMLVPRRRASEDLLRTRVVESFPDPDIASKHTLTPEPIKPRILTKDKSPKAIIKDLPESSLTSLTVSPLTRETPPLPQDDGSEFSDDDDCASEGTAVPRSVSPLPPSLSLHFIDHPQLDLSMSSAFDTLLKGLHGSTSPKKGSPTKGSPKNGSPRKLRSTHRRSRSFSSFNNPLRELSHSSTQSLASKVKEEPKPKVGGSSGSEEEHPPSLTMSDHGRTFSGASSSMVDSSPPRTPRSNENQTIAIYSTSQSSMSDIPAVPSIPDHFEKPQLQPAAELTGKAMRPRQLQLESEGVISPAISHARLEASDRKSIVLEPPVEIKPQEVPKQDIRTLMKRKRPLSIAVPTRKVSSEGSQVQIAEEMRQILAQYKTDSTGQKPDKATLLRSNLFDCLLEAEKKGYNIEELAGNSAVRAVSVEWVNVLLAELNIEQPANERGACLECLAAIIESNVFSARALDLSDQAIFRKLMVDIMAYVLSKLSGKGVFHNTLLFAGRMLAFGFFRIEGIAQQLLSALPMKPAVLMRFARSCQEFTEDRKSLCISDFPSHLSSITYDTAQSYTQRLASSKVEYADAEEREAFHFRAGNWLRRWQSDDSELFPAFYKAYHRQLATYLGPAVEVHEELGEPLPIAHLLKCPGYAHLAAIFSTKCHSYIVGALNAVTTTSAANTFDANESAGFKGNVKPPVLETANRRLSEVLLNLTMSRVYLTNAQGQVVECTGQQLWASMIEAWIKALISRTSLYSPKGVFCLFDLIDSILWADCDQSNSSGTISSSVILDIPYLINVIRIILTETEHHLTLAKCVAFVWTHFETFTARKEDREELCVKLLLDPIVFQRLMLFWSQSVRSYVLRLVVFRLGHIDNPEDELEVTTVSLLNNRLESIRKRHDELEPTDILSTAVQQALDQSVNSTLGPGGQRGNKSTITMVENTSTKSDATQTKAERMLGFSSPSANSDSESPELIQNGTMSKASKWFKKSFGKQKKGGLKGGSESESESEGPSKPKPKPRRSLDSATRMDGGSTNTPSRMSLDSRPSQLPETPDKALPLPKTPVLSTPPMDSPTIQSNRSSGGDSVDSREGDRTVLEQKVLPGIAATRTPSLQRASTPPRSPSPRSPTAVQFEFEIPMSSPRSDSFDKRPIPSSPRKPGPSPTRLPPSPHMSRSFSKRSSFLHPTAASIAEGPFSPAQLRSLSEIPEPPAYDTRLHPYCIRMLAELEDVQREYDDWYAEDGPGRLEGGPPRLQVAWPFAEDEE